MGSFGGRSAIFGAGAAGGRDLDGREGSRGRSERGGEGAARGGDMRSEAESRPVEAPPPNPVSPNTSPVLPQGNLGFQGIKDLTINFLPLLKWLHPCQ